MKNLLLPIIITWFLFSCSTTRVVPLQGKYQETAVRSQVDKPFEKVWEAVIDLIADTGVSVKMIDKASGLVLADKVSFYKYMTFEGRNGKPMNPNAWIVTEKFASEFDSEIAMYTATGGWNMRIKSLSPTSTEISVKLHSIEAKKLTTPMNAASLGNFEKWILAGLKVWE